MTTVSNRSHRDTIKFFAKRERTDNMADNKHSAYRTIYCTHSKLQKTDTESCVYERMFVPLQRKGDIEYECK